MDEGDEEEGTEVGTCPFWALWLSYSSARLCGADRNSSSHSLFSELEEQEMDSFHGGFNVYRIIDHCQSMYCP